MRKQRNKKCKYWSRVVFRGGGLWGLSSPLDQWNLLILGGFQAPLPGKRKKCKPPPLYKFLNTSLILVSNDLDKSAWSYLWNQVSDTGGHFVFNLPDRNIKAQMIKCLIMEYKRSTFQSGLQARNVKKTEKNHNNRSYCIVHPKTG